MSSELYLNQKLIKSKSNNPLCLSESDKWKFVYDNLIGPCVSTPFSSRLDLNNSMELGKFIDGIKV